MPGKFCRRELERLETQLVSLIGSLPEEEVTRYNFKKDLEFVRDTRKGI